MVFQVNIWVRYICTYLISEQILSPRYLLRAQSSFPSKQHSKEKGWMEPLYTKNCTDSEHQHKFRILLLQKPQENRNIEVSSALVHYISVSSIQNPWQYFFFPRQWTIIKQNGIVIHWTSEMVHDTRYMIYYGHYNNLDSERQIRTTIHKHTTHTSDSYTDVSLLVVNWMVFTFFLVLTSAYLKTKLQWVGVCITRHKPLLY